MADGTDDDALHLAREEARLTLDGQLATLDDIDAKALSVFRLNVALAGVLLSALSLAAASDVADAVALTNPAVGVGVALFALSAAAAGLTYGVAGRQVGVGPGALDESATTSPEAFRASLVAGYADWIRYNRRTNAQKALLVTLAVLGTVAGALALGVGALAAVTGTLLAPAVGAVAVLVALVALTGLPGQVRRLRDGADGADGDEEGVVATRSLDAGLRGQRTFTGRDRER
ncbi:hypothetical protein ACFPYI_06185 [Halomarina salina]|uniref:Uncharacterized protein n=1 Tax=Halomarina salina TaxID=1872699 RepID=A0ABD5RJY5_9EURY|nr:hypothetical protein [Halomarina salina]